MKKIITLSLVLISLNASADLWTQKANFGGIARHAATGFFLNGKGYIGTGGTFSVFKKDLWEWDPITDAWTQKADFGGSTRNSTVGFAIGNLGYFATGSNHSDMWAYDPTTNTWTAKANFAGGNRSYAVGFELKESYDQWNIQGNGSCYSNDSSIAAMPASQMPIQREHHFVSNGK